MGGHKARGPLGAAGVFQVVEAALQLRGRLGNARFPRKAWFVQTLEAQHQPRFHYIENSVVQPRHEPPEFNTLRDQAPSLKKNNLVFNKNIPLPSAIINLITPEQILAASDQIPENRPNSSRPK